MVYIILLYLLGVNGYAVYVMNADKKKARRCYWRVPEERLFLIAILFGSIGILIGMKLFRHKTRHFKFVFGIPAILVIQLYLVYKLLVYFA